MEFVKTYTRFFTTRSDTNAPEIRAYLAGLMQARRGAKNMERMEESVPGFSYQNVHNAISHAPWDPRPLMDQVALHANDLLGGGARTRLVIDDTGFQKKGHCSVGVARQYIGRLGKIENCQIAVCASLASGQQSTLIETRLYLPEAWSQDALRCEKAGIPESERGFRSKTAIAREIISHQRTLGVRFEVVGMDSGYGSDHTFLHALDGDGETFVAEVHCDQHIWEQTPWIHHERARGQQPLKHPKASHPGQRVNTWADQQPDTEWQRLKIRGSDQGWVEVNWLAQRVWVADKDVEKCWWLLVWENPDETSNDGSKSAAPRRHYALSNASPDEDPRVLLRDAVERNVVERNFRDAKTETGMADYQTRGWLAWNHHMALVMLAMLFLTQEKMHTPPIITPEGVISITAGDITFLLERLLPQRAQGQPDEQDVLRMLEQRLRKREKDQVRRREKTRKTRPELMPDENPPR